MTVKIEDMFGNAAYEFVDLIKAEPLVSESSPFMDVDKKKFREVQRSEKITQRAKDTSDDATAEVARRKMSAKAKVQLPNIKKEERLVDKILGELCENLTINERVKLEAEYGNLLLVIVSWRGKSYQITMFFPQPTMPKREEVEAEIQKVYPGSRLMSYRITKTGDGKPILQVTNSKSKNYLLNNGTIGEQVEKDDQVEEGFKQADYVKMKRKEKKHADDAYKQGPDPQELSGKYRSVSRNRSFKMSGIRDAMMRGEDPRKDTRGGAYKKRGNPDQDHRANFTKNALNNPKRRVKKPGVNQTANVDEDWQKVNKRDKTDGMSRAAVKAYRRENPDSKLKTAVTGDPKPGSKDAKRRKSFCARSKGQQDMHNIDCSKTPDKAICKARRRWKC